MKLPDGPRWLALAMLLSLGGNAFLGGYLLGNRPPFLHPDGPPPFGPPPDDPGGPGGPGSGLPPGPERFVARLADRLPPDDAAILRGALAENREFFEAEDERRRDFPRRLTAALGAEPFDAKAFEQVLADHDESEYLAHQRMRTVLVKVAASLSPGARQTLLNMRPPGPPPRLFGGMGR